MTQIPRLERQRKSARTVRPAVRPRGGRVKKWGQVVSYTVLILTLVSLIVARLCGLHLHAWPTLYVMAGVLLVALVLAIRSDGL